MHQLKQRIEALAGAPAEDLRNNAARATFLEFREALTKGEVRAASNENGSWKTNEWVKRGILLGFRLGVLQVFDDGSAVNFVDKDTFPPRRFSTSSGVRLVPGGSSIREGAYVANGVICMPPMYINVGAYVDEGTLVDSNALVGSCAQVGKRVHLSAAAQIGGVLEPVNASPVIIEDDVLVGGNCGVYEGTQVRARAVLGAGTILTRPPPLYDLVHEKIIRGRKDAALVVPENAVVVPGSRAVSKGKGQEWGISLYTPVIVKYRDDKTDSSIELEHLL